MDLFSLLQNNLSPEKKLENTILKNDVKGLESILRGGIDVNKAIQIQGGNTALHVAAREGYFLCVEKLLDYNANATVKNDFGLTPIALAFRQGHGKCVEHLLRVDADLNDVETVWLQIDGSMRLWQHSSDAMISALLKATPNLNTARENLKSALLTLCLRDRMFNSLRVWVMCGFTLRPDQIVDRQDNIDDEDVEARELRQWLTEYNSCVKLLQHYCRIRVRQTFMGKCNVMYGVEQLNVPRDLKNYICFHKE